MKTLATFSSDLFDRNFIGFHQLLDNFVHAPSSGFPPYNIVLVDDDKVDIELAIAGFKPEEISVTVENGLLSIESERVQEEETEERNYHYRGISTRSFKRSFQLANHWEVRDATFDNGILTVKLEKEIPEEQKPKKIDIKTA